MTIKASLPEDTQKFLRAVRQDTTQFHAHILALRAQGWTLRSIAEPFDVSRVSAKNWEDAAQSNREALSLAPALLNQVPPLPLDGHGTGIKKKKILKDIPPADRVRIAEISVLASKNTRWSAKNSPQRLASEEMDRLIEKYVIQRKVPAATFARYAGVTRRAIMQRVEKNNRS